MKLNFFVCLVLLPLTLSSIRRPKWKRKCLCSPAKIEWLTNDSDNILLAWLNYSCNIMFKKKLNFIKVFHNLVISIDQFVWFFIQISWNDLCYFIRMFPIFIRICFYISLYISLNIFCSTHLSQLTLKLINALDVFLCFVYVKK